VQESAGECGGDGRMSDFGGAGGWQRKVACMQRCSEMLGEAAGEAALKNCNPSEKTRDSSFMK